jgi:hypothetical protein
MFVGEIEFSDLPIDTKNKMYPLAYGFLLVNIKKKILYDNFKPFFIHLRHLYFSLLSFS